MTTISIVAAVAAALGALGLSLARSPEAKRVRARSETRRR
jgi:hypothetical protein